MSAFVQNRVDEIKRAKNIVFCYVESKENPADIASRGATTQELKHSELWWHGPKWAQFSVQDWPTNTPMIDCKTLEEDAIGEIRKEHHMYEAKLLSGEDNKPDYQTDTPFGIDPKRFSSMTKLLRVSAYILRFIDKLRNRNKETGNLTTTEIENAKNMWINYTQRKYYSHVIVSCQTGKPNQIKGQLGVRLDENNILRCTGRLQCSELCESETTNLNAKTRHFYKTTYRQLS